MMSPSSSTLTLRPQEDCHPTTTNTNTANTSRYSMDIVDDKECGGDGRGYQTHTIVPLRTFSNIRNTTIPLRTFATRNSTPIPRQTFSTIRKPRDDRSEIKDSTFKPINPGIESPVPPKLPPKITQKNQAGLKLQIPDRKTPTVQEKYGLKVRLPLLRENKVGADNGVQGTKNSNDRTDSHRKSSEVPKECMCSSPDLTVPRPQSVDTGNVCPYSDMPDVCPHSSGGPPVAEAVRGGGSSSPTPPRLSLPPSASPLGQKVASGLREVVAVDEEVRPGSLYVVVGSSSPTGK